jgi:hypothetical protein
LPNTLKYICSRAFAVSDYGTSAFTGILTIPNSVIQIEYFAFKGSGFTKVIFGTGLISIGEESFIGCKVKEIIFNNVIKRIEYSAFQSCVDLNVNLILPNSLQHIGDYAFQSARHLTTLNIPNTVTDIGECAFGD